MRAYQKLDAWRVSHDLAITTYRLTETALADDDNELVCELRRTAVLVPAKLAHSSVRSRRDAMQYVELALGYLSELGYHLEVAHDRRVVSTGEWQQLNALRGRASFYTRKHLESLMPKPGT